MTYFWCGASFCAFPQFLFIAKAILNSRHSREFSVTKKNTALKIVDFQRCMAPCRGFEPPTYRLGVPAHVSYRVVRDALTCPLLRMNQHFIKEQHVTDYWAVLC